MTVCRLPSCVENTWDHVINTSEANRVALCSQIKLILFEIVIFMCRFTVFFIVTERQTYYRRLSALMSLTAWSSLCENRCAWHRGGRTSIQRTNWLTQILHVHIQTHTHTRACMHAIPRVLDSDWLLTCPRYLDSFDAQIAARTCMQLARLLECKPLFAATSRANKLQHTFLALTFWLQHCSRILNWQFWSKFKEISNFPNCFTGVKSNS